VTLSDRLARGLQRQLQRIRWDRIHAYVPVEDQFPPAGAPVLAQRFNLDLAVLAFDRRQRRLGMADVLMSRGLGNQAFHEALSTSNFGGQQGRDGVEPGIPARVPQRWIDPASGVVRLQSDGDTIDYDQDVRPFNRAGASRRFAHKTGITYNFGSNAGLVRPLRDRPTQQPRLPVCRRPLRRSPQLPGVRQPRPGDSGPGAPCGWAAAGPDGRSLALDQDSTLSRCWRSASTTAANGSSRCCST
jgi:hypothetical protein